MRILIAYASTEGQARKIARFVFDRIAAAGHSVELLNAADASDMTVEHFDAAVLAGSVHMGKLQTELVKFAQAHCAALNAMPTLFLAVSLAAAGDDPEDWKALKELTQEFRDKTGWTAGRIEHIAGAFRFTDYDFFQSWAMRWIAAQKGQQVVAGQDKEYTDWAALEACLAEWLTDVAKAD
jgi:menaquinone-dependent protoporphyrinogen oxidase